jgi:SP family general alpha glucoside:H+ symporter-like MFS transporter
MFAKFVCGAGIGMMQATLPMYLGELAPTQLRGFMMVIYTGYVDVHISSKDFER